MSIKIIDIVKPKKEEIKEKINYIKYKISWPFNFFIYVNIVLYFLYFVHKIFF